MKYLIILFVLVSGIFQQSLGQAKIRKMPPNINHTSINNFAPFISLDGNIMVYVADVAEDNVLTLCYSQREGVNWKDPVVLPKTVNSKLNFLKGFGLSPDGMTLYLSNTKSNGLGGFDLYSSQFNGVMWSDPVNIGLPINSKGNESNPSFSADGSTLFFMRCEKMDFNAADLCKIMMVTKKSNGQWDQPVELPASINTGNSQTPRMMGDGETLIFSSNKLQPNQGGMDLYYTKLSNGQWSVPRPLDFANTPKDDQYVSSTSSGRYLLRDVPGTRESELVELLFPSEVKPKGTIKIDGNVAGVSNAFVSVYDFNSRRQVFSTKPSKDGNFVVYMNEGGVYDLSVDPEQDNYTFYSKKFDMTSEKFSLIEKVTATLKPLSSGDEIELAGISFKPNTSELSPSSSQELRRLVRLMQGNPSVYFSIQVSLQGFEKDSVRSNPDLTELKIDTIKIPVTYKVDSVTTAVRDSLVIKSTFHNDRTLPQSKAVFNYLLSQGIPAGRMACSGKAIVEALPEKRRVWVTAIAH